jgi:hypothetical protein
MLIAELRQELERNDGIDDIKKSTADLRGMVAMIQQDIASPLDSSQARKEHRNQNKHLINTVEHHILSVYLITGSRSCRLLQ